MLSEGALPILVGMIDSPDEDIAKSAYLALSSVAAGHNGQLQAVRPTPTPGRVWVVFRGGHGFTLKDALG